MSIVLDLDFWCEYSSGFRFLVTITFYFMRNKCCSLNITGTLQSLSREKNIKNYCIKTEL